MSEHTKGRLVVDEDTRPGMQWNRHIYWANSHNALCFMAHSGGRSPETDEANARRLVACWNRHEGESTEDVEAGSDAAEGYPGIAHDMETLRADRDELIEALRETVLWLRCATSYLPNEAVNKDFPTTHEVLRIRGMQDVVKQVADEAAALLARHAPKVTA